ncbi:MAG: GAF domain-containing protein [Flavobacterium sp.]|uniref:ATP-binding protein n=1 Tax=Flavobacterium sp. TaxID=239 RepID=UPI00120BA9F3|nr:ATP-binding protein [Flavobacterium sp.]RZJ65745.1 MAG: GAF domain-containing protein [Flavobacterium sp.]
MKIKDIVNRELVNLTNCEHEPIHIPGSIQPHGFLLGIKIGSGILDFCSANTIEYIKLEHEALLGNHFSAVVGKEQFAEFEKYTSTMLSSSPLKLNIQGEIFNCTIHKSGDVFILEGEPIVDEEKQQASIYDQTSQFLSYMHETHTLKDLCQLVAEGTRDITGYDRVMVYRFDKDYNGEVFAESCTDEIEPFLGLHYPHTDIPKQARELYLQNLLRLIVDIGYTPVPIYTVDDAPGKNLDLGHSVLRSTSPIHIQYLQNMGVGATLTISLIHQKKLWGLIACHHYSAKNLTPEIRLAAQLQGNFLTSQIDVRQSNEEYEVARKTNAALEKMNSLHLLPKMESLAEVIDQAELLELCNASGVSIQFGDRVFTKGFVPEDHVIKELSSWLFSYTSGRNFSTDRLVDFLPHSPAICQGVSGLLYHSLGTDFKNNIIWYRAETETQVNWAGDPSKAIIKDEKGLYPRNSFKLWKEFVKNQSLPWISPELISAANYAHSLQRQMNLMLLTEEGRRNGELNEILKETNRELENINWISTHDLQEPLRKIQLIASRLLSKEDETMSAGVVDSLMRMNNSAKRMQTLLIDILKYTKIQHTKAPFETVDLEKLIDDVANDLGETDKSSNVEIGDLPQVYGIPFLLKQLFSNLLSNSFKYRNEESPVEISVAYEGLQASPQSSEPDKLFHVVSFADNGIGFEPKFSESIFNIFTRLHASSEYKGAGVGLALCRKVMQTHKGYISATGTPGKEAVFSLFFPADGAE